MSLLHIHLNSVLQRFYFFLSCFRIIQLLLQDEPNEITEPEPEPEMEVEEAPKFDMCKHPYKDWEKIMPQSQKLSLVMVGRMSSVGGQERGPPSLCKVRHASHGDCYVTVSCGGAPSKVVKVEQGFGAGTVPNCRNCRLA